MEILLSFVVGCLVAGGTYLLLRPHLLRLFFGLVLLSNAVNLLIFTMGRLTRGTPPLIVEGQTVPTEAIANPLSQAIVLTSIVISFGIASFMLVLVWGAVAWILSAVGGAGEAVGAIVVWIDPQSVLPASRGGQVFVLATREGRTLALHPEVRLNGAPFAAERFGLDAERVSQIAPSGGALSGARFAESERILGVAALADAPLQTYALGPAAINQANWRRTLIFYILMFLGPLFAAMALCALLLIQMGKLRTTQGQLEDSERRFRLAIEAARCGVWDWDLETDDVFITESFARMVGRREAARVTPAGHHSLRIFRPEDGWPHASPESQSRQGAVPSGTGTIIPARPRRCQRRAPRTNAQSIHRMFTQFCG